MARLKWGDADLSAVAQINPAQSKIIEMPIPRVGCYLPARHRFLPVFRVPVARSACICVVPAPMLLQQSVNGYFQIQEDLFRCFVLVSRKPDGTAVATLRRRAALPNPFLLPERGVTRLSREPPTATVLF